MIVSRGYDQVTVSPSFGQLNADRQRPPPGNPKAMSVHCETKAEIRLEIAKVLLDVLQKELIGKFGIRADVVQHVLKNGGTHDR